MKFFVLSKIYRSNLLERGSGRLRSAALVGADAWGREAKIPNNAVVTSVLTNTFLIDFMCDSLLFCGPYVDYAS